MKDHIVINLFIQSNILLVEAVRLPLKYGSLLKVSASGLIFRTVIPVIQYAKQGILYLQRLQLKYEKHFS